jgi:cation:H+ antiporter
MGTVRERLTLQKVVPRMLLDLSVFPLWVVVAVLCTAALAICVAGAKLAHLADRLADRTGMGEIIAGALFVGGSISLPGIITSITTAAQGYPGLAIGNAIGGLTA